MSHLLQHRRSARWQSDVTRLNVCLAVSTLLCSSTIPVQGLTPRNGVLSEKLTVPQLVTKSRIFTKPVSSLPHSLEPATCPYPVPDQSSPCPRFHFFKIRFNIIIPSTCRPSTWNLSICFPHQDLSAPLFSTIRAASFLPSLGFLRIFFLPVSHKKPVRTLLDTSCMSHKSASWGLIT